MKFPRSKITLGADGVNDGDVSSANPLPIEGTVDLGATDNAVLDAIAASLAGTLTVGAHAVTNAGTFAVQVSSAIPADTNNIGDVDVLSVPADPFGANADAASTSGSISAKLRQIATNGIPITGTVTVGSHAVTNAGTFAVQAAQSGTWTVDLGATDNAVLDSILAALQGTLTVTGGGGGTEYTEDVATPNPIVGTATMMERDDALSTLTPAEGDWAAMRCSATGALWVEHNGAITCNAGTNLNTSLLALEAGGNLAAVAASASIMDDWDESDRAKVNIIAGQAGVAAAAGSVGANTQRMTLASDDPAVTALQIIDNCISGNEAQVDIVTQPARAATTDTITAKLATDAIQNGTTALTPKFAIIDAASSGDNTILAAVTSKKIRVLSCFLVAAGAVNVRFESGASGTALTGQMNLTTNSGFVLPFNPVGWFETASNTLLNLELSGATSVDGSLTYVEV